MRRITTTHADRVSLDNALRPTIYALELVELELRGLLEDVLENRGGTTVDTDPGHVERVLSLCADTIYRELLDFHVALGDSDFCGEEWIEETAKLLVERRRVSELQVKTFDLEKKTADPAAKAKIEEARQAAAVLPDAQAITILEEVLKP